MQKNGPYQVSVSQNMYHKGYIHASTRNRSNFYSMGGYGFIKEFEYWFDRIIMFTVFCLLNYILSTLFHYISNHNIRSATSSWITRDYERRFIIHCANMMIIKFLTQ